MKIFTIFFLALCCSTALSAQSTGFNSPYKLSYGLDIPAGTVGLGLNFAYFLLDKKTAPLTEIQLAGLDPLNIPKIDRSAAYNWSKGAALGSDFFLFSSLAYPSLLLIDNDIRKDFGKVGAIWAETLFLNAGITSLTKVLVKRNRPYTYNPDVPLHIKQERDSRYSFFSGHASVTASMTFMTATVFTDYHPHHKALPYIWTGAILIPAATALLRWRAGKHFFSDVLIGYLVGATVGFIVPQLHKIGR
jgi:membrane-associated phospholipid phosphatase